MKAKDILLNDEFHSVSVVFRIGEDYDDIFVAKVSSYAMDTVEHVAQEQLHKDCVFLGVVIEGRLYKWDEEGR